MPPENPDQFDDPANARLDRRDNRTAIGVAVVAVIVVAIASFILIIGVTSANHPGGVSTSPSSSTPH